MKTTKPITALILGHILQSASFLCLIWALISFIIYLAKDTPFNWNSIYWTIGLTIATIACVIVGLFSVLKSEKKTKEESKNNPTIPKFKSKFQERLEQTAEKKSVINN